MTVFRVEESIAAGILLDVDILLLKFWIKFLIPFIFGDKFFVTCLVLEFL